MIMHLAHESKNEWVKLNFDEDFPASVGQEELIAISYASNNGIFPQVLQQRSTYYISNDQCTEAVESFGNDIMCTSDTTDNQVECNEQLGGPLLSLGDSTENDLQVGINSWYVSISATLGMHIVDFSSLWRDSVFAGVAFVLLHAFRMYPLEPAQKISSNVQFARYHQTPQTTCVTLLRHQIHLCLNNFHHISQATT